MHMFAFIDTKVSHIIGTPLTGHFNVRNSGHAFMVVHDDEKVVMDENFDYDPTRALDLVEMNSFELVAKGELPDYSGAMSPFSFWKASAEGLFSVGWGRQSGIRVWR